MRTKDIKGKNNPNWRGGKIERTCKVCNQPFSFRKSKNKKNGKGIFCSRKCFFRRSEQVKINCEVCNKEIKVKQCRIKIGGGKTCSKKCHGVRQMKNMPRKETSIEKAIAQELIERGIEYRQNIPISVAHTIPDFVLTNKVVIYCDGEYWHSKPGCKNKDCRQDFLLGMNGYKVFRFTGSEIKKSAKECVSRISL